METVAIWCAVVLPKHRYRVCVCTCLYMCMFLSSALPASQKDFSVMSASSFSESCTKAFLKQRDRVWLDGNKSVPPKQDVEALRCSS